MPILELSNDGEDTRRILATMLFPADAPLREQCLALMSVQEALQSTTETVISLPASSIRTLLETPSTAHIHLSETD
jgi:hypothetical protein